MASQFIHIIPFPQKKADFSTVTVDIPWCLDGFERKELIEDLDNCYTGKVFEIISPKLYTLNLVLQTEMLLSSERKRKEALYKCLCELQDVCEQIYGFVQVE